MMDTTFHCLRRVTAVFLLAAAFLSGIPAGAFQQDSRYSVKGKVTDDKGEPIVGANILEKGTTNGTFSDVNGVYSLNVLPGAVLSVSALGFMDQEITVAGRNTIDVILPFDTESLDEVVVVGYGTQKKGHLTNAISTIGADAIMTTNHASLAQNLEGKIPGLQIRQQSGEPGNYDTWINVRGFGTPLFVIDGIVRDGADEFQRLNPSDIENISILKDASAAVYGLNAANGVILVTTKKGIAGAPKFTYTGVTGLQMPTDIPVMTNAAQFLELTNDANVNAGGNPSITREELDRWRAGGPGYESTDWYAETIRPYAPMTQHNFSVRGGNNAVNYFVSFGYLGESGLLRSDDIHYNRYTIRSNITAKLSHNLVADISLSGRMDKRDYPGDEFYWIFKATRTSLPTETPYVNGNPDYPSKVNPENNPLTLADKNYAGYGEIKNKAFQSQASLTYTAPFLEGLVLKATGTYDSNDTFRKILKKEYYVYTYDPDNEEYVGTKLNNPSTITNSINDYNRMVFQAQANYNRTFAEAHTVGAMVAFEANKNWSRNAGLSREYDVYTNDQVDQGSTNNQKNSGTESEGAFLSWIGRFNYNFKSRYFLEYAFRYDGSYRYAPGKRWGFFPVISGAWRISEEPFFKENVPFINNLKLRASYGKVGENAGTPFQYVRGFSTTGGGLYEFTDGSFTTGAASPGITNADLTWYTSKVTDLGLDLSMFKGKLSFEFDVYQRDRSGLLSTRLLTLPNTFGGELPEENLNSDRVQGLDFQISHNNTIGDFRYDMSFNFNYARTKLMYTERAPYRSSMDKWRNGNTYRWSDIVWAYDLLGQYQSMEEVIQAPLIDANVGNIRVLPGDYVYLDANGDGMVDTNDMLPLFWGGQPKIHYGFNFGAYWKNFDLNVLLQGSGRYTIRFSEVYSEILCFKANTPAYFMDRWHLADPYNPDSAWVPGKWPAARFSENMGSNYRDSEAWRKDATYLRLKSIELGYTIPAHLTRRINVETVRFYVNGHNLFTLTDPFVRPFDPEKLEGKYNAGLNYPLTKLYNVGVSITF